MVTGVQSAAAGTDASLYIYSEGRFNKTQNNALLESMQFEVRRTHLF